MYNTCIAPRDGTVKLGRPRKITEEMFNRLKTWILDQPQSPHLSEMTDWLFDEFEVDLHPSTVYRYLTKEKWSWKQASRLHRAQNEVLCISFLSRIIEYSADQIVVLDESAANENCLDRVWGWSPRGVTYRMHKTSKNRGERWSILPAMGINGYLEYDIVQGSYNGDRFHYFVRRLLAKMNRFPGPRSVLLLDNVKTHYSADLEGLCNEAGVRIEWLPPYSPDLSPIEESFAGLKGWMMKNRSIGEHFSGSMFGLFLHLAVREFNVASHARGYFRHCGFSVDDSIVDVDYRLLNEGI